MTDYNIPVHPQPSIYLTTVAEHPDPKSSAVLTCQDYEAIVARPKWDFQEADRRLNNPEKYPLTAKALGIIPRPRSGGSTKPVAKKGATRRVQAKRPIPGKPHA